MVVDSADQVRRLVGDDLPAEAETVLDSGGVLDLTNVEGDQKFVVLSARAGRRLFVIRGQARRLRAYSSRLVVIGLGPRWTRSVLGIQAAVVLGVGLLAGVTAGILGVKLAADNYVVTSVPAVPIALACGATIIAAGLATALAARALTAAEHPAIA